ncbi:MAG TPA: chemotaxis protein CheX [Verrucomicrobiae bacterium]|nr:chemotaxis protein CheX [Verrucomicrobiae bacterium]
MTTPTEIGRNEAQIEAADRSLVEATTSIISTVCKIQPTVNAQWTEANLPGEKVIAVVSFVGDLDVNIFLGLPSATAVVLASKFAGFEIPFESSDMADAVGELTNMVAGDLKIRLDRCRMKANISVPTVFRGQDLIVATPRSEVVRQHCFHTGGGDFMAGLCSKKPTQ